MLISIVIPTYNNVKTIEKTIISCIEQDFDDFEVLAINNNCDDGTDKILEKYKDKIRIYKNNETVSMYDNHNLGFKYAKGDYVIFCHADDLLFEYSLKVIANKLQKRNYPKKYILWGHSYHMDYYINLIKTPFKVNELICGEYNFLPFLYGGLTPSGTLYHRESMLEVGGFINTLKHRLQPSDWISMLYFALNDFKFEMIDEILFSKKFDSTYVDLDRKDVMNSIEEAGKALCNIINQEQVKNLFRGKNLLKQMPFDFYYALSYNKTFRNNILKGMVYFLLKNPLIIKDKYFYILLTRLINV